MRYTTLVCFSLLMATAAWGQEKNADTKSEVKPATAMPAHDLGVEKKSDAANNAAAIRSEKTASEKIGANSAPVITMPNPMTETSVKSGSADVKQIERDLSKQLESAKQAAAEWDKADKKSRMSKDVVSKNDVNLSKGVGSNGIESAFGGDVVIASGTALVLAGSNTALTITGDFTNNGTVTADKNSVVNFIGTTQAFASGSVVNFGKLRKSGGGTLTLANSAFVDDSLFLTSGIIATGTNTLNFDNSADGMGITGASNASYIDGAASYPYSITAEQKPFPLGSNSLLRTVSPRVAAQTAVTRVAARLNAANALTVNSNLGGMQRVSQERYYELVTTGANTAVYDLAALTANTDDGIGNLPSNATLRVATTQTGASGWTAQPLPTPPNTTIANLPLVVTSNTFGTSENVPSGASFFIAFGSVNAVDNPLPVVLESFMAESRESGIRLTWRTGAEIESRGFIIMKKKINDVSWNQLAGYEQVPALRTTNSINGASYTFTDNAPMNTGDKFIYRLDEVGLNGVRTELMELQVESRFATGIKEFNMQQNYPNPFNPSTTIRYDIKSQSRVRIEAYNIIGQRVAILVNELQPAGRYTHQFNAASLSSGVYFYRITANTASGESFNKTLKMVLVK
jgi:hypothetical protein